MTRILRLLLIAAVALPLWQPAAAQEKVLLKAESNKSIMMKESCNHEQQSHDVASISSQHSPKVKAPSLKGSATESMSITICDGTNRNQYIPIHGNVMNANINSRREFQFIYSKETLGLREGDEIKSLTFYSYNDISTNLTNGQIKISLGETTSTTLSELITNVTLTAVYTGSIPTGVQVATFTFTTPYTYRGGNLLVDILRTQPSNNQGNVSWLGVNQSTYTGYVYVQNGTSRNVAFLPKATFEVEGTVESRNIVVKDSTFFKGISYNWIDDNGQSKTSNLTEIATNPKQIIAMLKEIYTNKNIPGNLKRGFTERGGDEPWNDCHYSGVGTVENDNGTSLTSLQTESAYHYEDSRGWNIPGDVIFKSFDNTTTSSSWTGTTTQSGDWAYYAFMDSTQYRPNEEGLTLILVEIKDDFKKEDINNLDWNDLETFMAKTLKSARIITEARRTGDGFDSGTLFKIDCDKMNKFFLLAKGQLCWKNNSYYAYYIDHNASDGGPDYLLKDFCGVPAYIFYEDFSYSSNSWTGYAGYDYNYYTNGYYDYFSQPLFYHMFEQFSPVTFGDGGKSDIYQELVNMQNFGVVHDCASVEPIQGHGFWMYGDNTIMADCQDVRDMMFFIPDYRMMKDSGRDNNGSRYKFSYYNQEHQPIMGLYVIRQDEITPTTKADDYYMLNLHWRTNLDDFLPGEDQEFELFQVVYNEETGIEEYVPVYYMNAQGQYTDADGHVVDEANKVPIVLHLGTGEEKSYANVYVKRLKASQQVTYAIRGRDTGHFLSLQMSNLQSYIIPGTDPAELVSLVELTHYSRYNPQNEKNCYSNRFKMINNVGGVKRADLTKSDSDSPTMFTFYRKTSATDAGVPIATATVTSIDDNGGAFTITMQNQSQQTEYPKAKIEGGYAGYHPNPGENNVWTANFTYTTVNGVQYVNFGDNFILCDNFTVDVSSNEHPNLYIYEVKFNVPQGQYDFTEAHGNAFRVPIYKTDSRINGVFTKEEVDNDINGQVGTIENIEFEEQVQYSSKTEILRYDAFRYNEQDQERYIFNKVFNLGEDESIVTPNGIASNQGGSYTPTMGETTSPDYYAGDAVSVNVGQTAWAKFVDKYPTNTIDAGAYLYAPVVETFSVGKNSEGNVRTDYNYYGGPMQSTAVGKLAVARDNTPELMSTYNWTAGGKKYAYYNIILNVSTKEVPAGYQIYKIRAWRTVHPSILGEEYITERLGDENGKYMFEEINFGTEAMDNFINNGYELGAGDASVTVNGETISYTLGTFGAQKLRTDEEVGDNSVIDELNATFVVRMYFTRAANLSTTSGAPMLKDVATDADGKYYIVEQVIPFTQKGGNVPTGLESLNARQVVGVKYYNVAGIESDTPFKGVNIVVTRYSDGSSTTTKILK